MVGRAAQVYELEAALRILVRNATEEFGFVPRDVYQSITDLPDVRKQHVNALAELDYSQLKNLIGLFVRHRKLDGLSHGVVAVYPVKPSRLTDDWEIDFKSIRIAMRVVESMRLKGGQDVQDMYDGVRVIPESSVLAGWIFKAVAHRAFSGGAMLQCTPMNSNEADPPTFSTFGAPFSLAFSGGRVVTRVDFSRGLSDVTLDSNRYYISTATDNPLFDSFMINPASNSVVIHIFQITISATRGGSAMGYFYARQLKAHVRNLFMEAGKRRLPKIEAEYFLVCPDDKVERQWEMPAGWSETTRNHHRGHAFCIRGSVSKPHGTLHLFAPNIVT